MKQRRSTIRARLLNWLFRRALKNLYGYARHVEPDGEPAQIVVLMNADQFRRFNDFAREEPLTWKNRRPAKPVAPGSFSPAL